LAHSAVAGETIVGNYENKYASSNPVARRLVSAFLDALSDLYRRTEPAGKRVLEVGAGEGELAMHLVRTAPAADLYLATDLTVEHMAGRVDSRVTTGVASAYALPYESSSFDVVVCCEVLEHLEDPDRGLAECARVAREWVLISTPWEPAWRMLNVARGKYWRDVGNTPGHVQHFSRAGLERLASRHLQIVNRRTPLPWTALLGTPLR
jgi:ubiquinone/menaquinone biosynthesis C-methylase UbiE